MRPSIGSGRVCSLLYWLRCLPAGFADVLSAGEFGMLANTVDMRCHVQLRCSMFLISFYLEVIDSREWVWLIKEQALTKSYEHT